MNKDDWKLTQPQRLRRIKHLHATLAILIPHAWADDPKVCGEELRGLCEALTGIERAQGIKRGLDSVSEPFWMQDIRLAQRRLEARRAALAAARAKSRPEDSK